MIQDRVFDRCPSDEPPPVRTKVTLLAKNQNTYEKRRREVEKKQRSAEKLERKREKKLGRGTTPTDAAFPLTDAK